MSLLILAQDSVPG